MVKNDKCFIVAEAGVNHNGLEHLAIQLVEAAAAAGADAVKFQTFSADRLVAKGTPKAEYQRTNTGTGDQYSMLRELELPDAAYCRLAERSREMGVEFLSTPFDESAADMLIRIGMRRIKVPSGELTNHPFLDYLAGTDLPMILSTGMSTLEEVEEAVAVLRRSRSRRGFKRPLSEMLTLLHCTSNYPAAPNEANLRAMQTLQRRFGLPVGYSDHTEGILASVAAVAAGACVIEKHFTLDRNTPGCDHRASIEPGTFGKMVDQIRAVETLLGSDEKIPCPAELPIREIVRRSVTLKRSLAVDTVIAADDVVLLRPGSGIAPKALADVIGRRLVRDLPAGTTLKWDDLK